MNMANMEQPIMYTNSQPTELKPKNKWIAHTVKNQAFAVVNLAKIEMVNIQD